MTELVWFILLIFVGYYFLIMLPQKRERTERQKMLNALAKGDRVVTTAGIHGKVVDIAKKGEMEIVTVECGRNIQIEFSRSAIAAVVKKKGESGSSDADADSKDSASSSKTAKGGEKRGS